MSKESEQSEKYGYMQKDLQKGEVNKVKKGFLR